MYFTLTFAIIELCETVSIIYYHQSYTNNQAEPKILQNKDICSNESASVGIDIERLGVWVAFSIIVIAKNYRFPRKNSIFI